MCFNTIHIVSFDPFYHFISTRMLGYTNELMLCLRVIFVVAKHRNPNIELHNRNAY